MVQSIDGLVMKKDSIERTVASIVSDVLGIEKSTISPETLLVEDLGCDSVHAVEILFALQDELGIRIPQAAMAKVSTVDDIIRYLVKKTGKKITP
ncbi:MAG: acyl carrier protein [Spirochaetes bacterium]|nr:acyl carrier protein [Spirochaetota bacterium]